jgi:phosphatidate cytidylyltransferase
MSKNKSYNIYGILFLILSFYSIYLLRNSFEETYIYLLLVILICSLTDIGGYFFGKIFKGPKLTKISPKKTYSGMVGGYLLPIIFFYLILVFTDLFAKLEVSTSLFLFVFLISTTNQLGDILISFFKRVSKIKDTGKIIPGHGGLLDRIDGMIFAFPISYIIFLIENFT